MTSRQLELLPASIFALQMVVASFALSGCSPVYTFQFALETQPETDPARLKARLGALLDARGFRSIGFTDQATGDIGCGRNAPDRGTFVKEGRGTKVMSIHRWVWVHQFSCEGAWHVVIVSSIDAEREAAQLRDSLSAEFQHEIAAGQLRLDTSCRLALE